MGPTRNVLAHMTWEITIFQIRTGCNDSSVCVRVASEKNCLFTSRADNTNIVEPEKCPTESAVDYTNHTKNNDRFSANQFGERSVKSVPTFQVCVSDGPNDAAICSTIIHFSQTSRKWVIFKSFTRICR